jgi:hypothetical protein
MTGTPNGTAQADSKRAYGVRDLSDLVPGLNRTRVYEEIGRGTLRARKVGRRTIILAEDLAEYIASLPVAR